MVSRSLCAQCNLVAVLLILFSLNLILFCDTQYDILAYIYLSLLFKLIFQVRSTRLEVKSMVDLALGMGEDVKEIKVTTLVKALEDEVCIHVTCGSLVTFAVMMPQDILGN